MSSQYLQRLQIDSVEEVGVDNVQLPWYQQQVSVVEVVDQDGNPYQPSNWDDLVVDTKSSTTGSTVLGSVLTGTPATWTGGTPPVQPVNQWQRSSDNSSWSGITPWSNNDQPMTYTTVLADQDMYVRYASKCTDANGVVYGSGNSVGPMVAPALVVTTATKISNGTFVNPPEVYPSETLTPVPAVYSGGFGPVAEYTRLQYYKGSTGTWTEITPWSLTPESASVAYQAGTKIRAESMATDDTGVIVYSNGPEVTVGTPTTIGTLSTHPADPLSGDPGEVIGFTASCSGDADPLYTWNIRSGPGQITSAYNFGPSVEVTIMAGAQSGYIVQLQLDASDPSSTDTPQSTVITIVVN